MFTWSTIAEITFRTSDYAAECGNDTLADLFWQLGAFCASHH